MPGVGRSPERLVRNVWRVPLGTPYPQVIEVVRRTVQHPQLYRKCSLAVDATGVGAPVVEMMHQSGLGVNIWAVVISAGEQASKSGRGRAEMDSAEAGSSVRRAGAAGARGVSHCEGDAGAGDAM